MSARPFVLTADLLLRAYRLGMFPMAESRASKALHWLDPEQRGILPLHEFHLPRSLFKTVRGNKFTVTADADFAATIAACAQARSNRPETWINVELERLFIELHQLGFAHSVESWKDGRLVGGLYGACMGGAFFGESMFHRRRDASKIALVALVQRLKERGYVLLDTQANNPHLKRFGCTEIPAKDYLKRLEIALQKKCELE